MQSVGTALNENTDARTACAEFDTAASGVDEAIRDWTGRWWVLQTLSRNEKVVAKALSRHRVANYLPLVTVPRVYGGRRTTVSLPLFPGYLFLCGDASDCDCAWQTKRVARVLDVSNQNQLKSELDQISGVIDSGEPVELYPALKVGARCRIIDGTFKGVEGVVLRRRDVCKLYISVTTLGQSAVVEIERSRLEPVD